MNFFKDVIPFEGFKNYRLKNGMTVNCNHSGLRFMKNFRYASKPVNISIDFVVLQI
ncbi:hypothetical protein QWY81_01225 [Polaribacter undariae]|uniref:Uncharacterized protein n=1 Tax=Polaribacter sejongensis TaxID=985043 RepID=A0AAJ1VF58_9FLAO|nr:hypothetical protein [Polaribacter undariae]MDN3618069.1 hypothetical protein [Polaribacter undariae]UWD30938.1 hypothetical protein NQP51_12410 [Polaribacter undariae]